MTTTEMSPTGEIELAFYHICTAERDLRFAMRNPPAWEEPADPEWNSAAAAAVAKWGERVVRLKAMLPNVPPSLRLRFHRHLRELEECNGYICLDLNLDHLRHVALDKQRDEKKADAAMVGIDSVVKEIKDIEAVASVVGLSDSATWTATKITAADIKSIFGYEARTMEAKHPHKVRRSVGQRTGYDINESALTEIERDKVTKFLQNR